MLITHVISGSCDTSEVYLIKSFLERLSGEFDLELVVPEGSEALFILSGVRVKLTALPLGDDDENMIRNIYIISRHLKKTGARVVHSHGSVCGTLAAFLISRGDVVAIKDYYAVATLGRVLSALSPRAKLSLTLSSSPSDSELFVRAGVRRGSIVSVPYGVDVTVGSPDCRMRAGGAPIISAYASREEECALFLSAVAGLARRRAVRAYVEAPDGMASYIRHLSSALGIGRSVVSFGVGAMPPECVSSSTCFVFPSLSPSAIPLPAARFMSFGVPAAVPDTPRCLDLVKDGCSGAVFRFGDSFSLASAIERLVAAGEKHSLLSSCARDTVLRSFSLDASVLALSSLYRELV